ncbi:acyl-CoA dehydrogenase/oxidase C-terminal [Boletus reticuloceps]|uniref:Acyl-coenzyme A oxidase n=1 Tax=Boletus reticuloceps TaxID=495285 RepID=A0A8I2YM91_9AGAM|nr:acyl-CoA dehydrogenase/oxidase C-terminal [Boletus reticuloceps]
MKDFGQATETVQLEGDGVTFQARAVGPPAAAVWELWFRFTLKVGNGTSTTMAPDLNAQTAKDMQEARDKVSFDLQTIRDHLFGEHSVTNGAARSGRRNWESFEQIERILRKEPVFDKSSRDFIGRVEAYKRALAITKRLTELQRLHQWTSEQAAQAMLILSETLPITLHDFAFEPVLLGQGSTDLVDEYWKLVAHKGIQGCYLQTELGHGTNVARLETTATYIPETEEFELHSPTLTSTKWWIGALGKTATHGIVQAKLVLPGGKDVGPHLFLVQLRSLEDHSLYPGITAGDIGPKAGGAALDNGFARFDHVRIPWKNMLSKFATVTQDGRYIQPQNPKHSFAGMMYIRASMVTTAGWTLARGITIAIRYATVRRQGEHDDRGLERQVIQYPSTYYRLLPILSRSYVFIALGRQTTKSFTASAERIKQGDLGYLAEIHAMLCGLKVLVSTETINGLETARRALGGHGYSIFAGIGRMYADYLPAATFEGDNFVLDGQVVRAALKSYNFLVSTPDRPLGLHSSYLRLLRAGMLNRPVISAMMWQEHAAIIHLLEWRAALSVQSAAQNSDHPDAGINYRLSKAVTEAFVATQVGAIVSDLNQLSPNEASALKDLYLLVCSYLILPRKAALVDLLAFSLLQRAPDQTDPTRDLRAAINAVCLRLLPNAVGFTDAFTFSDWSLDSALGVSNGRVYEELWKRAQLEPLNQTNTTPGYEESLKPMLEEGRRIASSTKSRL